MLKQRIIYGLALLPFPVLALYFGTPWFELFAALVLSVMGWEWEKMVLNRFSVTGMTMAVCGICSVFLLDVFPELAWTIPAVASVALYCVVRRQGVERKTLYAFGMLYSAYPMLAITYLLQNYGFESAIWLFGLVWAMDSGAYLFGRLIGGPKLMPKISPKKTWAGLIGGMLTSALWGAACAFYYGFDAHDMYFLMLASAVFGAISQGGDLFESSIKRSLNVKDSSNLIPGHGGIFDRMDALLAVAPVVVLFVMYGFSFFNVWG